MDAYQPPPPYMRASDDLIRKSRSRRRNVSPSPVRSRRKRSSPSSDDSSDDSRRKSSSRRRNLSPSPERSKRRSKRSRSPHRRHRDKWTRTSKTGQRPYPGQCCGETWSCWMCLVLDLHRYNNQL